MEKFEYFSGSRIASSSRRDPYLETLGDHFGDFFSGGGVVRAGMVTLHPVAVVERDP